MVFDLMYRNGRDLSQRPLRERRSWLEELLAAGADRIHPVRRLASNGPAAWTQVLEKGYEGMVAKNEASAYVAGKDESVAQSQSAWMDGQRASLEAGATYWTRCDRRGSENRDFQDREGTDKDSGTDQQERAAPREAIPDRCVRTQRSATEGH
jgi:hypothetical protein